MGLGELCHAFPCHRPLRPQRHPGSASRNDLRRHGARDSVPCLSEPPRVGVRRGPSHGLRLIEAASNQRSGVPEQRDESSHPESDSGLVTFADGPHEVIAIASCTGDRDPSAAGDKNLLEHGATAVLGLGGRVFETGGVAARRARSARGNRVDDYLVWHHRADQPSAVLVDAFRRTGPGGGTHVWIACEVTAVRKARSYLLDERGLPRPQVTARGYWCVGEASHPDHDFGEG